MPRKSDLLTINNEKLDRRVKLTAQDKAEIVDLRNKATQTAVAKAYGVNRRTISFIWYPEKLEENKQRRAERGGSAQYYDRKKHAEAMKEHRNYKKELYKKGLIQ